MARYHSKSVRSKHPPHVVLSVNLPKFAAAKKTSWMSRHRFAAYDCLHAQIGLKRIPGLLANCRLRIRPALFSRHGGSIAWLEFVNRAKPWVRKVKDRCWIQLSLYIDQFRGNSTLIETKHDELNIGRTTLALQTFCQGPKSWSFGFPNVKISQRKLNLFNCYLDISERLGI